MISSVIVIHDLICHCHHHDCIFSIITIISLISIWGLDKKIEMFPTDMEAHSFHVHEFFMYEEIQLEKIRQNYRNRADLVYDPTEDRMHEAILKICCGRTLSSDTFYQVS